MDCTEYNSFIPSFLGVLAFFVLVVISVFITTAFIPMCIEIGARFLFLKSRRRQAIEKIVGELEGQVEGKEAVDASVHS